MKDYLCPIKRNDILYMYYKEDGERCVGNEQIVEREETNQSGAPMALFTQNGQKVYDFRAIFKYHLQM